MQLKIIFYANFNITLNDMIFNENKRKKKKISSMIS